MYEWNDYPKTENPVLKFIRNFITCEFDYTVLYPNDPSLPDVRNLSVDVIEYFLQDVGEEAECDELHELYEKGCMLELFEPYATALHEYNKIHDAEWRKNNFDRNEKLLRQKHPHH